MMQIILFFFVVFCCIYGCYTDYLKAVNEYSSLFRGEQAFGQETVD